MDENNILQSIKKLLGISYDYTPFDADVKIHINSAFNFLDQLGAEYFGGFQILTGDETWSQFTLDDVLLNLIKSYIYLRVKLIFDPPNTSFALDAIKEQIKEYEFRILVHTDVPIPEVIPGGY